SLVATKEWEGNNRRPLPRRPQPGAGETSRLTGGSVARRRTGNQAGESYRGSLDLRRRFGEGHGRGLHALFQQFQRKVDANLFVQPAEDRLGRGKRLVLEELVGRRSTPAKGKVSTTLLTHLDPTADLVFQPSKPRRGHDRFQGVRCHVPQR